MNGSISRRSILGAFVGSVTAPAWAQAPQSSVTGTAFGNQPTHVQRVRRAKRHKAHRRGKRHVKRARHHRAV